MYIIATVFKVTRSSRCNAKLEHTKLVSNTKFSIWILFGIRLFGCSFTSLATLVKTVQIWQLLYYKNPHLLKQSELNMDHLLNSYVSTWRNQVHRFSEFAVFVLPKATLTDTLISPKLASHWVMDRQAGLTLGGIAAPVCAPRECQLNKFSWLRGAFHGASKCPAVIRRTCIPQQKLVPVYWAEKMKGLVDPSKCEIIIHWRFVMRRLSGVNGFLPCGQQIIIFCTVHSATVPCILWRADTFGDVNNSCIMEM